MTVGTTRIESIRADITTLHVDAIVNAANASLAGGGGVDGAIHRAGGPAIALACRAIGGCPTGSAAITEGGGLPVSFVIHAVAPRYSGRPRDAELLTGAYATALRIADEQGARTIAFPSLGTGAYGYPLEEAAPIAIRTVIAHLRVGSRLECITFCLFSDADLATYRSLLGAPPSSDAKPVSRHR